MSSVGESVRPRHSARVRRRRRFVLVALIVAAIAAAVITVFAITQSGASSPETPPAASAPADSATPQAPPPLSAAQQLLATTDDPNACAVSFEGDGLALDPQLQTQGQLYRALPIPQREGAVFAGWYSTAADAAGYAVGARVNGAEAVACVERQQTLHAAWKTPEENAAENTRVPVLMYHQFTTKPEGENNSLKLNFAYIGDFEAHIAHIASTGFYLPTWDELSAFIDGRLFLPARSVIVTDDDADSTWYELAVPVVDAQKVLTTSFAISKWTSPPSTSTYVILRSHTHEMHEAGANGDGRMVNWTVDEIAADMETSAQLLGAKEVMAYPFGHFDERSKEGLRKAGFEMARTIEQGYVTIGTDKLALPCIRINYGMTVDDLIARIG